MLRPLDPRNRAKKPEPIHSRSGRIDLTSNLQRDQVSLEMAVSAWNKAVRDHESQGHRITEGPLLESQYSYGSLSLTYTYEWDNLNYSVEKAEWDAAIAAYEVELAAWKEFEAERKKNLEDQSVKSIDQQIARAEHRLANLKAAKAGQPLPFPKG